jgi:transcriptional regulator of acetoin/glycerol metabolism
MFAAMSKQRAVEEILRDLAKAMIQDGSKSRWTLRRVQRALENECVLRLHEVTAGNVSRMAKLAGTPRSTMYILLGRAPSLKVKKAAPAKPARKAKKK